MSQKSNNTQNISREAKLALEYSLAHKEDYLEELISFIKIPSVGTQPEMKSETAAAAAWLAEQMKLAGLNHVATIPTKGNPLVYGDWLKAGSEKPTVLIYGHYDVQPADPLHKWKTPPFEPTILDGYLYARGTSDDKCQLYIHIKCVEAYLEVLDRLPVNVKFIFEGEEESGGSSLENFVSESNDQLSADVALMSDTPMISKELPAIVYGLRGMCYVFLDVTGPSHDLHSGSYGGGIDNPLNALAHIIAKLKDESGKILIPGFYDQVRPLTDKERQLLAENPVQEDVWLANTGAPALWGEPDYTLAERIGARPTLDVNGIIGGYTGEGAKTVLPSTAHAKISMRLVPDQKVSDTFELFREYIVQITPPTVHTKCTFVHGGSPALINRDIPAMHAATEAYEVVFGNEPVFIREGGSIPVVNLFKRHLGIESILMGFGLPDDRIHSPNERFYLPNFFKGIECAIRFLDIYSRFQKNGES
jgi:acetylornithine deacetylase/succinyl-diaminopimelate desuccinylase-like protein